MSDTETVRRCLDCKWCNRPWLFVEFAKCRRPTTTDPITGAPGRKAEDMEHCSNERSDYYGKCGEKGVFWEPRP